jgi:integrase
MRGDGSVYLQQNSRFYWIRYSLHGKLYRESAETDDFAEAQKCLKHRLKEVGAAQLGYRKFIEPAQQKKTVAELMDGLEKDYRIRGKWNSRVKSAVKAVKNGLGDIRATTLTKKDVDRYTCERKQFGRANATVNNELQLLGQAFTINENVGNAPTIRKLPVNNAREAFFEKAEFEALVRELPADLQDYARFGYLTGWRHGEISSLSWADLDMEQCTMRLRHAESKNGEARIIPLEGELLDIFKRRWSARSGEGLNGETILSKLVFHRNGKPVLRFDKAWRSACERAGLQAGRKVEGGKVFHDFRRTAARNLRHAGVSEDVAMKITGHKTRAMFARYNITNEDDLKKAVRMTQEYVESLPVEKLNIVKFQKASGE